jgi:hypothetical protein
MPATQTVEATVAVHSEAIGTLKAAVATVDAKLDRLLWGMVLGFGSIVAAMFLKK